MKNFSVPSKLASALVVAFLIVASSAYLHSQVVLQNAFCEGIDLTECLTSQIDQADMVFEGTVTESNRYKDEVGDWKIKTVYEVEKIFKGNFEGNKITKITDEKTVVAANSEWYFDKFHEKISEKAFVAPKKVGTTALVVGRLSKANGVLSEILSVIDLTYQMEYGQHSLPKGKEHYILYYSNEAGEVAFQNVAELYTFLTSKVGVGYKDITGKKFIKPTFDEWKQIKKKKKGNPKDPNGINAGNEKAGPNATTISSITQDIPGGVSSILTISGSGFGGAPNPSDPDNYANIWFDATTYNGSVIKLDNYDLTNGLVSWTDEEIKIMVPGNVLDQGNFDIYSPVTLMSSKLRVITDDGGGSDFTEQKLNIPYSVQQNIDFEDGESVVDGKEREKITTTTDNIFYFYLNNEVYENCNLTNNITKALKRWRCKTGIDWRVKDLTPTNELVKDDKSLFTFGSTCCAVAHPQFGVSCSGSYEKYENDVEICSTIGSDQFCVDGGIYATFLHELGHVHGLNHTQKGKDTDVLDLMNLAAQGGIAGEITTDDLTGASDQAAYSTAECKNTIAFDPVGDYAMKDNAADTGGEPNCSLVDGSDPAMHKSPDLWNCHGPSNSCNGSNEMPKEGETNYLYAKVKNISSDCDAYGGTMEFYWTIGSTGEMWKDDWVGHTYGSCLIGDFAGSTGIGTLTPGEEKTVSVPWEAPLIDDLIACGVPRYPWDVDNGNYQVCFLARVKSEKDYNFLEKEGVTVGNNVRNSNNIVTRNTGLLDVNNFSSPPIPNTPSVMVGDPTWMFFSNNNEAQGNLDLVFSTENDYSGYDFQYVELLLSDQLFNKIMSTNPGYQVPSPNVIRLSGTGTFVFPDLPMEPYESHLIGIRLMVPKSKRYDYALTNQDKSFFVTHRPSPGMLAANASSVCFFTSPAITSSGSGGTLSIALPKESLFQIYDVYGRLVSTSRDKDFAISNLPNGVYFVVNYSNGQYSKTEKVLILR